MSGPGCMAERIFCGSGLLPSLQQYTPLRPSSLQGQPRPSSSRGKWDSFLKPNCNGVQFPSGEPVLWKEIDSLQ